jgi:SAM-dependent methyltransferase
MKIMDKMKRDWDRRARYDARFWIATEAHETAEVFADSGVQDVGKLLQGLDSYREPSWQVLEVGCGIGRMLRPLACCFAEVCGVDVSREMIAQSKDWLRGLANVHTVENSGLDLSGLPDDRFDLAFSYVVFQHVPKEVFTSYLFDIHRVLKPQGWLKFQVFMGPSCAPAFEDTITLRVYSEQELHDQLTRAGFCLVDQTLLQEHTISGVVCGDYFILARAQAETLAGIPQAVLDLRTCECADTISTTDTQMSMGLIKRHVQNGRHAAAIPILKDLVTRQPDQTDARLMLANVLAMEDRLPEAIRTAQELTQSHPTCYRAYVLLAKLYQITGDHEGVSRICAHLKQELDELSKARTEVTNLRP